MEEKSARKPTIWMPTWRSIDVITHQPITVDIEKEFDLAMYDVWISFNLTASASSHCSAHFILQDVAEYLFTPAKTSQNQKICDCAPYWSAIKPINPEFQTRGFFFPALPINSCFC